MYAVNCIGYIASYGAWALLCLCYATTLLQKFQYMNVLSYTHISLIYNLNNDKSILNALLECIIPECFIREYPLDIIPFLLYVCSFVTGTGLANMQ